MFYLMVRSYLKSGFEKNISNYTFIKKFPPNSDTYNLKKNII